jgi:hypothetical protein
LYENHPTSIPGSAGSLSTADGTPPLRDQDDAPAVAFDRPIFRASPHARPKVLQTVWTGVKWAVPDDWLHGYGALDLAASFYYQTQNNYNFIYANGVTTATACTGTGVLLQECHRRFENFVTVYTRQIAALTFRGSVTRCIPFRTLGFLGHNFVLIAATSLSKPKILASQAISGQKHAVASFQNRLYSGEAERIRDVAPKGAGA